MAVNKSERDRIVLAVVDLTCEQTRLTGLLRQPDEVIRNRQLLIHPLSQPVLIWKLIRRHVHDQLLATGIVDLPNQHVRRIAANRWRTYTFQVLN